MTRGRQHAADLRTGRPEYVLPIQSWGDGTRPSLLPSSPLSSCPRHDQWGRSPISIFLLVSEQDTIPVSRSLRPNGTIPTLSEKRAREMATHFQTLSRDGIQPQFKMFGTVQHSLVRQSFSRHQPLSACPLKGFVPPSRRMPTAGGPARPSRPRPESPARSAETLLASERL